MATNKFYSSQTAFNDLLFNSLLAFVGLFIISILHVNDNSKNNHSATQNVEFMISVTWPYENDDDVDTYVVDPLGNITSFNRREDGLMHLDRDDIGHMNDTITLPNGKKIDYKENREIVSIRGLMPGEYIVNVHLYSKKSKLTTVPTSIKIEKINPYKLVAFRQIDLTNIGEEKTVFRFGVDNQGAVSFVSEGPSKTLIKKKGS